MYFVLYGAYLTLLKLLKQQYNNNCILLMAVNYTVLCTYYITHSLLLLLLNPQWYSSVICTFTLGKHAKVLYIILQYIYKQAATNH
jgi:hypothetical protein